MAALRAMTLRLLRGEVFKRTERIAYGCSGSTYDDYSVHSPFLYLQSSVQALSHCAENISWFLGVPDLYNLHSMLLCEVVFRF
jgi:hypothetical protein